MCRVEEAAGVLDAVEPGWADRVDVDLFDVTDPFHCVLHYVFGDYTEVGLHPALRPYYFGDVFASAEYQDAWADAISGRQS